MNFTRNFLILSLFLGLKVEAQRSYKANSVLASGNWYKISVSGPGVYKMDLAFLNSLGIQGSIDSMPGKRCPNRPGRPNRSAVIVCSSL